MPDKKTSEQYISPPRYDFCQDDDITLGCTCQVNGHVCKCKTIDQCKSSKGRCHVVLAPPGDPQLLKPEHESHPDGEETADVEIPPGWEAFCACLTYTGTVADPRKSDPKPTVWTAPAGYKLAKKDKPCKPPVSQFGDWVCEGDDCTLVGVKTKGETQLVKLADPRGGIKTAVAAGYWAVFCTHLDKA